MMTDLISRQAAIDAVNELTYPSSLMDVKIILANLPTAQPTQTNTPNTLETLDCVSRQEAIDDLQGKDPSQIWDTADIEVWINSLPSAQPEPLTGVQDILQYLDEYLHPIVSPEHWSVYSELHDMVSMLPSAQPERKKGKWMKHYSHEDGERDGVECSECRTHFYSGGQLMNFCPNCGADMRGEQDG